MDGQNIKLQEAIIKQAIKELKSEQPEIRQEAEFPFYARRYLTDINTFFIGEKRTMISI